MEGMQVVFALGPLEEVGQVLIQCEEEIITQ
jgi:hypothetical protein